MRLFLATSNRHKVEEFSRLFSEHGLPIEVLSAVEAGGMPDVNETEETFLGNARLKALALRDRVSPQDWVLADDSGLEVAALGGDPGVRSARYAGSEATDRDNRVRLLERLGERGGERPKARFVCVLVLLGPSGFETTFEGVCGGHIVNREQGEGGFGYDSLFVPEGHQRTFAEMSPAEKDQLSHRGRALRQLLEWVRARQ